MSTQATGQRKHAGRSWTCERCGVTVSWMPDVAQPRLPASWVQKGGRTHCLACRREIAAEEGLLRAPADASKKDREEFQVSARIEFEVERDPDRNDGEIAKACRTSIHAVRKARERLNQ